MPTSSAPDGLAPGDAVLIRVRWCVPHRFVAVDDGRLVLYRGIGAQGVPAARPWPTGWENWRPPPEWEPLALPEGWDDVS